MFELTLSDDHDVVRHLPSLPADGGGLRRRRYPTSVRKNVCLFTLNGSGNGFSMWNILNGLGGF